MVMLSVYVVKACWVLNLKSLNFPSPLRRGLGRGKIICIINVMEFHPHPNLLPEGEGAFKKY